VALLVLLSGAALAQQFDVASVKVHVPKDGEGNGLKLESRK